jgi:hypothetical protein
MRQGPFRILSSRTLSGPNTTLRAAVTGYFV